MPTRRFTSLIGAASVLLVVSALGACTPGGQFDPTEVLSTDIFNTKKKIQGEREPLFPNGVPGTETGVPPDLVKGYQPPAEQPAADAGAAPAAGDAAAKPAPAKTAEAAPAEKPKPKVKPKPKPKVARAPASTGTQAKDPFWSGVPKPGATQAQQPAQPAWPTPSPGQPAQTNWPTPPSAQSSQAAPAGQTNWPPPPPPPQTQ